MNTEFLEEDGTLVFVYNADTGWRQAFWDTLHKYMRPDTYGCNLCKLTHGPIGPRESWRAFLQAVDRPVHFLHRDEYRELQAEKDLEAVALPAVLEVRSGHLRILLSARELNAVKRLEDLVDVLRERLA
ncbi:MULTISPECIES: hypothetical protein [unclassified Robiginitalea]|uniref:hypothetical protein n=1 Tax=Robiginitalea TaxID=252306 RepID=UPI00234A78EE|nr:MULTISPECIES: hypothetical protein [unclassified Robiginitalea]MDC6354572.1 hypothetical protein [Robiginitalea sp. PM2]MDC6374746.1 hypothetical protein [Robiginitalea sp. SP8]